MKTVSVLYSLNICMLIAACNSSTKKETNQPMNNSSNINKELAVIDSLLQDMPFTEAVAKELDAAYYKGIGQVPPPFLAAGEDSLQVDRSIREEKIAINIAGFYALECGIDYLCEQSNSTPVEWLEMIISKKVSDSVILLLNRFANATWKAGQPFRGLERIKRPNFIGSSSLPDDEVQKDYRQIIGAATKLKASLKPGTKEDQLQQIRTLLQDKGFAYQMASHIDSSYYANEKKTVPPFISKEEVTAVKKKSFKEEKIAINVAGFYAVECALNYLVTIRKQQPSFILQSITDNSLSKADKLLFARFANATWKAGQPFRSLDRITRDTFTPFYFLTEAGIEKDWVQVKAAAAKLQTALK
ncbi:MAG: hypothetical protein IPP72_18700 [Chitinophagaceae bacterium]|nr:hypothetical protein [Chitinophagaceae bacterium]